MSIVIQIILGLFVFCIPGALLVEMFLRSHETYATQEARRERRRQFWNKLRSKFCV